ncbi:MAG TPA: class I SAM-dependent methyltransferase [Ferruginibacter sp.]|jgi:2-polyprenyl-3-methyl-5-hydroxy-6-metoxy-1,4-benzoquinol methylase|nr:class I SAM-dependent methyltransferase [Ferruginibacter sp.]
MKRYSFEEIAYCEMCGDPTEKHVIIGQRLNQSQGLSPRKKSGITVSIKKCTNCQLIYSSPLPIPENIQDHYGVPPEEYWIPSYFIVQPDHFKYELDLVKNLLPFEKGMKALDIGAGIGNSMLSIEREGFDTYGFEPSIPFYEKAISVMKVDPDKLKQASVEDSDYPENTFAFATIGAVFEHLYHPAQSLKKILSWVKPNGIIHIEIPSSNYLMSKIINFYYRIRGTNYVTNLSPMHSPFHLYEFDLESFKKLATSLNFEIAFFEYHVGGISFAPKVLHPLLRKYMKLTNTGLILSVYLRKK